MTKVTTLSTRFKTYGKQQLRTVVGEVSATFMSVSGSKHETKLYIIEGHQIEPVLGDADAKALEIVIIIPSGKIHPCKTVSVKLVTDNLKPARITISPTLEQPEPPPMMYKTELATYWNRILKYSTKLVF